VKTRTTRTAIAIVTVLLVGTVALAAAEAVQHPQASQIPVVVTDHPAVDVGEATATAGPDVTQTATPTVPVVRPKPAAQTPDTEGDSSTREVVTPKMRDDSDADDNGGPSDHDADDGGSSSEAPEKESKTGETPQSAPSERGNQNTHKESNVQREHSSGNKN
jgi:hypothetical protein